MRPASAPCACLVKEKQALRALANLSVRAYGGAMAFPGSRHARIISEEFQRYFGMSLAASLAFLA